VFDAHDRCDLGRYRWTPEEVERSEDDDEAQPSLFSD
jgi:hypothetical protein